VNKTITKLKMEILMVKKIIIYAALLTTGNQFAMQLPTIKSVCDSIPQETVDYLKSAGRALPWLGGIAAICCAVTSAIQYYYADEIVEEVMHNAYDKITLKKVSPKKSLDGYNEYIAEIKNLQSNEIYGCIIYSVPSPTYAYHYALHPHIDSLKIALNHRGKGYGSILVKYALNKIVAARCEQKTISLTAVPYDLREGETTLEMLPKLIKFYEKLGAKLLDKNDRGASMRFYIK
jgi:GNAT superfamily N-acetyltransferase